MVVTDLSGQKRTQQKLLEAHRTVAESEQSFRFLVANPLVDIFIGVEARIVFINAEQQGNFGCAFANFSLVHKFIMRAVFSL